MSEYGDVEQIAALKLEQVQIEQALDLLDNYQGTVSAYTVTATISPAPGPVPIVTVDPGQSLMSGVRSSLIQRNNAINKELRDLGVDNVPADKPGGGPPLVEVQPA